MKDDINQLTRQIELHEAKTDILKRLKNYIVNYETMLNSYQDLKQKYSELKQENENLKLALKVKTKILGFEELMKFVGSDEDGIMD